MPPETRRSQHSNAIDAAKKASARRILYTSHVGADPSSPFPPIPDHAATEHLLQDSGVPFTSLRHGFYAQNLVRLMSRGIYTGKLYAPADGPVSWTTHADLATVDAAILATEGASMGLPRPSRPPPRGLSPRSRALRARCWAGKSRSPPPMTKTG